jgi:hypothetical protein
MTRLLAPLLLVCALAGVSRADGWYYSEALGGTKVKDELSQYLPDAFRARLAVGHRRGLWAVEGFLSGDFNTTTDYTYSDGYRPGGQASSLTAWGVTVKRMFPLSQHVELYMHGDASYAYGDAALVNFGGRGLGFGAGVQLKGRGSVLGLLFWPLFFTNIGPKMTAAIYLDEGYDFYRLHDGGDLHATPAIDAQLTHITAGFALGTDF